MMKGGQTINLFLVLSFGNTSSGQTINLFVVLSFGNTLRLVLT